MCSDVDLSLPVLPLKGLLTNKPLLILQLTYHSKSLKLSIIINQTNNKYETTNKKSENSWYVIFVDICEQQLIFPTNWNHITANIDAFFVKPLIFNVILPYIKKQYPAKATEPVTVKAGLRRGDQ